MVFSSSIFIFAFLPLTVSVYYLLKGKLRNYWLIVTSFVFFSWSQPAYSWIILASIILNYLFALIMDSKEKTASKIILILCIVMNLAILFYFKYFAFSLKTLNALCSTNFNIKDIALPIGISFFTFQGLSYVIDVYRKEVSVQKNPLNVALYIILFPQLVAGPIVRYKTIEEQITVRTESLSKVICGIQRFIIGLAKKVIIANSLASIVDSVWSQGAENICSSVAWMSSIAYTLQIFFDFSGYSDMAIGLGKIFGFEFEENFNLPYLSKSITEFWRRWHISLSRWFRDYVYIPLGGNRKHLYFNLFLVFLLTGIWHGASYTFVLWGICNGIFILVERFFRIDKSKKFNLIRHLYCLFVVNLLWILFRAPDISSALEYYKNMFGIHGDDYYPIYTISWYNNKWNILIFILAFLFSTDFPKIFLSKIKEKIIMQSYVTLGIKYLSLLGLFFLSIIRIVSSSYNPFIYFQF